MESMTWNLGLGVVHMKPGVMTTGSIMGGLLKVMMMMMVIGLMRGPLGLVGGQTTKVEGLVQMIGWKKVQVGLVRPVGRIGCLARGHPADGILGLSVSIAMV